MNLVPVFEQYFILLGEKEREKKNEKIERERESRSVTFSVEAMRENETYIFYPFSKNDFCQKLWGILHYLVIRFIKFWS